MYFSVGGAPPTGNKEKYGWLARLVNGMGTYPHYHHIESLAWLAALLFKGFMCAFNQNFQRVLICMLLF